MARRDGEDSERCPWRQGSPVNLMFQLRGAGTLGAARRVPLLSQAEVSTPVTRISRAVLKHRFRP